MADAPKRYHCGISVDIDRFADSVIERDYGRVFASVGITGVAAIRAACAEQRARGLDVFPPCRHTKPNGVCAGHRVGLIEDADICEHDRYERHCGECQNERIARREKEAQR